MLKNQKFMNKFSKIAVVLSITALTNFQAQAGNPDRQGEAGAYELTINPWGRSAVYSIHHVL